MTTTGRPPGRPANPPALSALRGGKDRGSGPHGSAVTSAPEPPPALRDAGREAWALYWQHGREWLAQTDRPLVARLCRLIDHAAELERVLNDEGLTAKNGRTGRSHAHALFNTWLGLSKQISALEAAAGFTPADRARLRFGATPEDDALARWMAQ